MLEASQAHSGIASLFIPNSLWISSVPFAHLTHAWPQLLSAKLAGHLTLFELASDMYNWTYDEGARRVGLASYSAQNSEIQQCDKGWILFQDCCLIFSSANLGSWFVHNTVQQRLVGSSLWRLSRQRNFYRDRISPSLSKSLQRLWWVAACHLLEVIHSTFMIYWAWDLKAVILFWDEMILEDCISEA